MNLFEPSCQTILHLLEQWEPRLGSLSEDMISNRLNRQNRSIRQILGHLVDSASNNTHPHCPPPIRGKPPAISQLCHPWQ